MQRKAFSSRPQKIFVGIDVHLKSWDVTCVTETNYRKSFNQPADPAALKAFLSNTFPNGEYHAVYESGFTGFSTYFALTALGIDTIVVNAADVPTTQKETVMKTDRRDSLKLALSLRGDKLDAIHVPDPEDLDDRNVVRVRATLLRDESRAKSRVKHMLHNNGVTIPPQFKNWSKAFVKWIENGVKLLGSKRNALLLLLHDVESRHKQYLVANRHVRQLIRSEKYATKVAKLMAIRGIGQITAITLLTEVGDFKRFSNERAFASYLGLVPTSHDSGQTTVTGMKSFRGNRHIGTKIVESSWILIRHSAPADRFFSQCCQRMNANKAIIRVARRLSNIILTMMKNDKEYDPEKAFK